jgi:hypothetical protein
MRQKVNLHLHTSDDPKDNVPYSVYQALDHASALGFDALALTCHAKFTFKKEYGDYGRAKGLLVIPGIEIRLAGKDVVILNCGQEVEKLKTFEDLKNYKRNNPEILVLAPHPFVWARQSLSSRLAENIELFDAIELTIFHNRIFNFNKKARQLARKYDKPLVATSDTHFLKNLERGFALVETDTCTTAALFAAIKNKKIKNEIKPMGLPSMLEFRAKGLYRRLLKRFAKQTPPTVQPAMLHKDTKD